jgi:hypothetical protein
MERLQRPSYGELAEARLVVEATAANAKMLARAKSTIMETSPDEISGGFDPPHGALSLHGGTGFNDPGNFATGKA